MNDLSSLKQKLDGEFHTDDLLKKIYATDGSVYKQLPSAVAIPKNEKDIQTLVGYVSHHKLSIIPRAAGTSLAGQCVGNGIVVDVSKYMNRILEYNPTEKWIRVQPGVIRDQVNEYVKADGLFFGPNTSTANRCMIGGMVGNNSCGSTSIVYGTTRDHTLEMRVVLSDGSTAYFGEIDNDTFIEKCKRPDLEGKIYHTIRDRLAKQEIQNEITSQFPKISVKRRNTGYAVDSLARMFPFSEKGKTFNMCKLLCGSEGTLAFTTEIKISLSDVPPPVDVVVAPHFTTINEAMRATQVAMKHSPYACELMDKTILDCTLSNVAQSRNRYFIEGDPRAVLMIEFRATNIKEAEELATKMIDDMKKKKLGYSYPIVRPPHTSSVWELRAAGLGLLSNLPGDDKGVACIEDTAVSIEDLANYIEDFQNIVRKYKQDKMVYYAHAGAGEIHLRPILNLKTDKGILDFKQITRETALLAKKYNGSLSGEHGDGRVRSEFIPVMMGEKLMSLFKEIKEAWDPSYIFNPGKIVNAVPMDAELRYKAKEETPTHATQMDFGEVGGMLRMAEKCNGSGDCRKLALSGGVMCPSYRATRDEKDSTRARANALREYLRSPDGIGAFEHKEVLEVMDLCLSCKGCTSECPSNVDISMMKAEYLYQHHKAKGWPVRSRAFMALDTINEWAMRISPLLMNSIISNSLSKLVLKKILNITTHRKLPTLYSFTLRKWYEKNYNAPLNIKKKVYLFIDEFTNYYDVQIGMDSIGLLRALGYDVKLVSHPNSGRVFISKGRLDKAKSLAEKNVQIFSPLVDADTPLIGIEPSAIFTFRDEYPKLLRGEYKKRAVGLADHTYLIEEFIAHEVKVGNITSEDFHTQEKHIAFHAHCYQKALSSVEHTQAILSLPDNYSVTYIKAGCCGMAGSFGYEAEHYDVSIKVGEDQLLPSVRSQSEDVVIVANGTSCRHQIYDGTKRASIHPATLLYNALKV